MLANLLINLLSGAAPAMADATAPEAAAARQPSTLALPERAPIPTPSPSLPGGSFAPSRSLPDRAPAPTPRPKLPTDSPLMALLTGDRTRQFLRTAGAGMANLRDTGGDPFMSFGQGFGGGQLYQVSEADKEVKAAAEARKAALDAQTAAQKDYHYYSSQERAAGRTPMSFAEYERSMRASSATTVNVAGDKAGAQEMAKLFAKRYDDITTKAQSASEMLSLYDLAQQGIDSGVRTGAFGDTEQSVRQFAQALGIADADNAEKVSGGELLRAVQNRMALTMRNPDSGMGMPGAVSDRDLIFLKDAQIGLDRSPEGNRLMLEAFRRLEERKIEVARLADEYVAEHGALDFGFNSMVRKFAQENPLFDDIHAPDQSPSPRGGDGLSNDPMGLR